MSDTFSYIAILQLCILFSRYNTALCRNTKRFQMRGALLEESFCSSNTLLCACQLPYKKRGISFILMIATEFMTWIWRYTTKGQQTGKTVYLMIGIYFKLQRILMTAWYIFLVIGSGFNNKKLALTSRLLEKSESRADDITLSNKYRKKIMNLYKIWEINFQLLITFWDRRKSSQRIELKEYHVMCVGEEKVVSIPAIIEKKAPNVQR